MCSENWKTEQTTKLKPVCMHRIHVGAIRPKLEYACPVRSGGNASKLVKLQTPLWQSHQLSLPSLTKKSIIIFWFFSLITLYQPQKCVQVRKSHSWLQEMVNQQELLPDNKHTVEKIWSLSFEWRYSPSNS